MVPTSAQNHRGHQNRQKDDLKADARDAKNDHETKVDDDQSLETAIATGVSEFASAALWPLLAFIIFVCLRHRVSRVLDTLTIRLKDKNTNLAVGGFSLVRAQDGKIEALEASIAQLRVLVEHSKQKIAPADAWKDLEPLATEYEEVEDKDWSEKVRKKEALARRMGAIAHQAGLTTRELVEKRMDPYFTAAAQVVLIEPRPEDVEPLCDAAERAKRNHPRYCIAMALGSLASAKLVKSKSRREVLAALDVMQDADDPSLTKRLAKTRSIIEAIGKV